MMPWLFWFLMCATKPTPQASCSLAGSYKPWRWGRTIVYFLGNSTRNQPEAAGKKAGVMPLPGLGRSANHGGQRAKYTAKSR
jgi:hypothetical protein